MSFGALSIALSLVFGCLLLALCAQLYYFLWWKKRRTQMDIEMDAKGVFYWGCWKTTPCAMMHGGNNTGRAGVNSRDIESTTASHHEPEMELDLLHKSSGEEGTVESELMRLHNLAGPPRFLFPIKEESKEDLESEDRSRKGSRTRSLSDLMLTIDTPFLTPVASSPLKCCSLPVGSLHSYKHQGFNPLFESSTELDYNRFRSSPPPKFKFMRDAEEKLHRKLMEEAARRKAVDNVQECCGVIKDSCSNETLATDFSEGSFLKFIQNNKDTTTERKQLQQYLPQFPSGSSQILPLASSPTTFRPLEKASIVH